MINYILESLPRIGVFRGGKWQNGSSTNREFAWIGQTAGAIMAPGRQARKL